MTSLSAPRPPGAIRVGVGGWDFDPWRGSFFPPKLPKSGQLAYSSRVLTALEVNSTFYKTQSPATFRRWAEETPADFVFTLKGPRYVVNRRDLGQAAESLTRFLDSGIAELGDKLGPINWQLPPTKVFNEAEITAFLGLLPFRWAGRDLQHALEVRHSSFLDPAFVALAGRYAVPIVYADSDVYPAIADPTGPFVYGRLQMCREEHHCGYSDADLELWADRAAAWAKGEVPSGLNHVGPAEANREPRPVYLFFISGAKVLAPAAAQALLSYVRERASTAESLASPFSNAS